jgi:hypothetical protein
VISPAVDPASVADLYAAPAGIDGGHEVQLIRSCDPGQNDVSDPHLRRVEFWLTCPTCSPRRSAG